ncbi:MAG: hypothetical protein ACJ8CR_27150 [Roseiflexaceae bacterium]
MKRYLLIGLACGTLALALAGGAVLAGPSSERAAAVAAAQPTPAPTARPGAAKNKPRQGNPQRLARLLGRVTADMSGIKPQDVLAGLRDGKSLAQIAQTHGKTADDVIKAARAKLEEQLKQAVAKNRLTQDRADAMLAQFDQAAPQVMNNQNLGAPLRRGNEKRGPAAAGLVQATAEVTGMQPKDVLAELRAGKSLAQIAQAHGKTADDILAKLRELGQQRLSKALDKAKELIDKPGMGRGQQPGDDQP